MQRHLPSEGSGGMGGGRNPSPGCSSGSYGLGEPCISLSPYPRLGFSPRKKKKKKPQFENLLPKEGYACGRGSGEFGARLWGRGLAGTDGEDLAHVLSSPKGLPDSVGGGGGGREIREDCLE